MKVIVLDAPGLLYPDTQAPPTADPVRSGVLLARKLIDAMAVPVLLTSQAEPKALKEWCKAYDVFYTWHVHGEGAETTFDYWDREVLTTLGRNRLSVEVVLTADERVAVKLADAGLPTIQFRAPGGMPDWAPRASAWRNDESEEE